MVLDTFPRPSETFVLRELQQLLRDGAPLHLTSFHRQPCPYPAAAALLDQTTSRPSLCSLRFWRLALPELLNPRLLALLRTVLQETGGPDRQLLRVLPTAAWLAAHFRSRSVAHVHAHFAGAPALAARAAAHLLDVSYSVSVHGSDLCQSSRIREGNVRAAAFVLTCTARNRERVVALRGGNRAHVHLAYHGVDLERFRPAAGRTALKNSARRILCVARLEPKKGVDTLIAACALLQGNGVPFECLVLGEGGQRDRLERQARGAGLSTIVKFHGAAPEEEVLRQLQEATLFALPCRRTKDGEEDGLPNVLVEALACGVPVVSTSAGAVPELIRTGVTGVLAPPDDPAALAAALRGLLDDAPLRERLSKAGRQRVEQDFDLRADPVLQVFRQELLPTARRD